MEKLDLNRLTELLNKYTSENNYKNENNDAHIAVVKSNEGDCQIINLDKLVVKVPEDFFKDLNLKADQEALEKKLEELNC